MGKIKVLHFITGIDIGGAELLLLNYLKNAKNGQYDFSVAYLKGNSGLLKSYQEAGITLYPLPLMSRNIFIRIYKLYKIIKSEKFDILHNHLIHSIIIGRILGWICRVRVILSTEHNLFEWGASGYLIKFIYKITNRADDAIIAISEAVKQSFVRHTRIKPDRISVIYNGIGLREFRDDSRKVTKFKEHYPVIGCVSRLHPVKGQRYLIEAISSIIDEYPELMLVLVGGGDSREELVQLSNKLGVIKHVSFEGPQENIAGYLHAFDIFVLPSIQEGLSISLIEALAAGKNIIASDIGGIPEVVENMKEGILVPVKDSLAIADGIKKILLNKELAISFRENALAKAETTFDINQMIKAIDKLYSDLYQKSR